MSHLEQGRRGKYWKDDLPEGLSLVRRSDRIVSVIMAVTLAVAAILVVRSMMGGTSLYHTAPLLTAPFFTCGAYYMIRTRLWTFVAVAILMAAVYFLGLPEGVLYLLLFVTVGATGCVALVNIVQRIIFYRVVRTVEYINIKGRLGIWDRAVAFIFNIPGDLDTRNIVIDYDLRRDKLPWREMSGTISLALMTGMLLWIYISMNPAFIGNASGYNIPVYVFSLVLLIPLLVLPWSIFKSLDVRIETNYRDYRIYDGIKATLTRMALPVFAALIFVMIAINNTSIFIVLAYILTSGITITLVIIFTSVIYYVSFEPATVDDINSKWKLLRPAPLLMGLDREDKTDFDRLPGTPVRDKSDFGRLNVPRR